MTDRHDGFGLTTTDLQAEIDRDRRSERRLVWYTMIALAVVAIVIAARLTFL
jgi:hypothetical protein